MNENKNFSQKSLVITVAVLLVLVIGISVAFAAMQANLSITTNSVSQSALTWNVGFQTGTVQGTEGGTGTTGRVCGDATVTANSVTVANTQLSKPDDSCTYALVVKNTGSVDARLGNVTAVSPTSTSCTPSGASMVCGNITYKLTTDSTGNTLLTTGGTLAKTSGTQNIYLVIKYTGTELVSSDVSQNNGGFTLVYNQN